MEITFNFGNYYEDALAVLKNPRRFFRNSLKKPGTLKGDVIFYAVLSLVGVVLGLFSAVLVYPNLNLPFLAASTVPQMGVVELVPFAITTFIAGIAFSFIWAFFLNYWIKIFKGKKPYKYAYKLYIYSRVPTFLFGWIPIISAIAWIYSLYILVVGTQEIYGFSRKKAILVYALPMILVLLLFISGAAAYLLARGTGV